MQHTLNSMLTCIGVDTNKVISIVIILGVFRNSAIYTVYILVLILAGIFDLSLNLES